MSWTERTAEVDLTREQIREAPEFNPDSVLEDGELFVIEQFARHLTTDGKRLLKLRDVDPDVVQHRSAGAVRERDPSYGHRQWTRRQALTLEAGSYVLLCNIYSEEEQEAHYAEGMRIAFTVE